MCIISFLFHFQLFKYDVPWIYRKCFLPASCVWIFYSSYGSLLTFIVHCKSIGWLIQYWTTPFPKVMCDYFQSIKFTKVPLTSIRGILWFNFREWKRGFWVHKLREPDRVVGIIVPCRCRWAGNRCSRNGLDRTASWTHPCRKSGTDVQKHWLYSQF